MGGKSSKQRKLHTQVIIPSSDSFTINVSKFPEIVCKVPTGVNLNMSTYVRMAEKHTMMPSDTERAGTGCSPPKHQNDRHVRYGRTVMDTNNIIDSRPVMLREKLEIMSNMCHSW